MLNDGQAAVMVYEIDMFCELHVWAIHKLQLGGWWGAGGEEGGARTGVYAGAKVMGKVV